MDDLINEVRLYFEQKKAQKAYHDLMIYVLLDGHKPEFNETELCASLQKNGFSATPIHDGLKTTGVDMPSEYAIAYGLALKQLYPALDQINFLNEDLLKDSEKNQEKQDAGALGGVLGIILLVLILLSKLAEWTVTSGFAKVQQAAYDLEDKIELIEQETDQLLLERARLAQFQELFKGRNELAPSLHAIGEIASGSIWFTEVRVVNENNANRIILKGFSTSESGISGYMDRLEKAKEIQQVKLVIAERVSSDVFYSNETYIHSMIYRFEMDLMTPSNFN
jgi:Tfp pilus assembly protein PilN